MSESEYSSSDESEESAEDVLDAENIAEATGPYQDEPIASSGSSSESDPQEGEDQYNYDNPDGIPRRVLEQRYERTISVETW